MSSPIADLTYRNYDGPLDPPFGRWWVVAKSTMRLSVKKKGFWIWGILSAYWYLILCAIFYFLDLFQNQQNGLPPLMAQVVWKDQFLNAFNISQLLLFILALLIGTGSIANDNRANALLVYLSKPSTKLDYLAGKWVGIFLLLTAVTLVPMVIFYAYFGMSYASYGFFTGEPWLWLKLLAIAPITAAFHASVSLGISSLFNHGRLAGAVYAGIYFVSMTFTNVMKVQHIIAIEQHRRRNIPLPDLHLVHNLFYCSIDGLMQGLAKFILGTNGSALTPGQPSFAIPPPNPAIMVSTYLAICAISLGVAWSRIRAVEVVRG